MRRKKLRIASLATLLLSVASVLPSHAKAPQDSPLGLWEGKLKVAAGIELRLVFKVVQSAHEGLKATFDSVDQGAKDLPVDSVALENGELTFAMKALHASFRGKLNEAGTEAAGTWSQGSSSLPLTLKRTEKASEVRRPQTPKPPFPYLEERVTYENPEAKVTLAGTITKPKGKGPFPAVILISGSGPQDRDETILGHKPFLVLADHLTRRGIAVLRVDDRGVGGSSGNVSNVTTEDFAGDVGAGMAFLRKRREIDPNRIGLIGHSEGGLIAPIVATRSKDVAFIVLMAGTGLPGDAILASQAKLILEAMGTKPKDVEEALADQKRVLELVKTEKDPDVLDEKLRALSKELVTKASKAEKADTAGLEKIMQAQLKWVRSPWFRFFLVFDPRPTLSQVKCPVLAIIGEKDLQVPAKENLAEISKALRSGGNERVTIRELPRLNHLFQTSETGAPSEYARIEETIAPEALKIIGDWVEEQVK